MTFKEGDVITFQGRIMSENAKVPTTGTIFTVYNGEILAVDSKGHIYQTKVTEAYLAQKEEV